LAYDMHYWRTRDHKEIDFVLYGASGFVAIEVKRSAFFRASDLATLRLFQADYPMARCLLFYGGTSTYEIDGIHVLPIRETLPALPELLGAGGPPARRASRGR